ncbi:unnamed protein product [Discula destructiva]
MTTPIATTEPTPPSDTTSSSNASSRPQTPPPPPNPSADRELTVRPPLANFEPITSPQLTAQPDDIFKVPALAALKLLSAGVEALVRITGDIPPTPPPSIPHVAHMRGMQAEKESIVRNHSEKSLARLHDLTLRHTQDAGSTPGRPTPVLSPPSPAQEPPSSSSNAVDDGLAMPASTRTAQLNNFQAPEPIDGVRLKPAHSPDLAAGGHAPPPPPTPEPYVVIGANSQPLNQQHSAITRKFYSKKPPPIGISDYLLRIHRFCPMSTAVYLATSLYIHRLAVDERAVAVTKRNAHRLLLAGLRVAMKALEDLSYPHAKVAKVGGVSDLELARLEISFCFLCGFELMVGSAMLQEHWITMKEGIDLSLLGGASAPIGGMKMDLRIPTQSGLGGRFSH